MVALVILGILTAIAVPYYGNYQRRARQAEVKANMGGIFLAEFNFFAEHERYSSFSDIGFSMNGSTNRYTYRAMGTTVTGTSVTSGAVQAINAQVGAITPDNTVFAAASSQAGFTATATANLDTDPTVDQWHVNDRKDGLHAPDVNDL